MTERYPSFISATNWNLDAAPAPLPDPHADTHGPIEEPTPCPASPTDQQVQLRHPYFDPYSYNHDLMNDPHESATGALGISTGGITTVPLTAPNNHFNPTPNDPSFIPPFDFEPHAWIYSDDDPFKNTFSYNQSMMDPLYSGPSNTGFQIDIPGTLDIQPTPGPPQTGCYDSALSLPPDVCRIPPRTGAHLYPPHALSSSTSDGSMRASAPSSGPSPSFQHHRTPSSVSSLNLHTPDQNLYNLPNWPQPFFPIASNTSSQRLDGARTRTLAPRQVARSRNAPRPPTEVTKQANSPPQVSGYRPIAPKPPGYVKPQTERPPERKRVRRESKQTPILPGSLGDQSPPFNLFFAPFVTPTTVNKSSFSTSSRKAHEKAIRRAGIQSDAGLPIAPTVQEGRDLAPTHAPAPAASHTLETEKGSSTLGSRIRTGIRSPSAKPRNSTSQHATTLPTLGKRQKRSTTDSNSSSNSSKTPTTSKLQSRANSQEGCQLASSPQQTSSSRDRTRPVRKNSGQIGGVGSANSGACVQPASSQTRPSPSRIPVPVAKRDPLVPLGGRSNPVVWAFKDPPTSRSGPRQNQSVSRLQGLPHSSPTGQGAMRARPKDPSMSSGAAQRRARLVPIQNDNMDPEWIHQSPLGDQGQSLMLPQTLPETGNFEAEGSDSRD